MYRGMIAPFPRGGFPAPHQSLTTSNAMNRIESALETLNVLTPGYEVSQWGRGDYSLYRYGEFILNTRSAAVMLQTIRVMIRDARSSRDPSKD